MIQFIRNSILKMFIVLWFKVIETTMLLKIISNDNVMKGFRKYNNTKNINR